MGALLACSEDDEVSNTPRWISGYPQVAYGAVSADLNIQTDQASRVYWIIATQALQLGPDEVVRQAITPEDASIKFHGVTEATANDPSRETITGLQEHTKYFVYLTAQSKNDTLAQNQVEAVEFTTHYRQDTSEYQSTAESRGVKYLIYRPEEVLKYPDEKYPVLFFLSGTGEVGTAAKPINMIRNGSLPEYIHSGNDVPMIVMSIQHIYYEWNTALIDEGVDHALATYPIDTRRVYITGMSRGAYGCWSYALEHADRLAAAVPISGGADASMACNLKNVAVWAFHNSIDDTVSPSLSKDMIAALEACPSNKEVKGTWFPDEGHNAWRRVYNQNHEDWSKSPGIPKFDIYAWLLSKSR
jgi:predicted peptidase